MKFDIIVLALMATTAMAALPGHGCRRNGQKLCKGVCVQTNTNPSHCGKCPQGRRKHPDDPHRSKSSCSAGATGYTNGQIGNCKTKCGQFQTCENGQCKDPRPCSPGGPTYMVEGGKCYEFGCGKAIGGQYIGSAGKSDIARCAELCSSNPNCAAAEVYIPESECGLYSTVEQHYTSSDYNQAIPVDGSFCQG